MKIRRSRELPLAKERPHGAGMEGVVGFYGGD
jgi:hypothetical protein